MKFVLLLILAAAGTLVRATPAPVAFDYFEYTGRDDIFATPLPAGHYRNPILAGFYPDPSVCRVGDDYYLINSTFSYYPGIPIFHSRDLVNWTQIGHVIDRPTQLNFDGMGVTRGLFAPTLSYHNGIYYVLCTMVDRGGNFMMTATNAAGPWSDPTWLHFDGIDPSLFFDTDGKAWLVNNGNPPEDHPLYQGHRAIWEQEFDVSTHSLVGPRRIIVNGGADLSKQPVWIEGPHLYHRGAWYYLSCAEGGTSDQHSQVIFRSREVTGPFEPWKENPILTQRDLDGTAAHAVTCTGHADLVQAPDGNWWSVFLACRPFAGKYFTTGRETFLLPVKWTPDDWPRVLPAGERVPLMAPLPDAPSHAAAHIPLTGNFTWRDDFDGSVLSPLWLMIRQPHETWWREGGGKLSLVPRIDSLSGTANPSFLARRLQHAKFTATTALTPSAVQGVSAGLVAFQSETHHYFFGVHTKGDDLLVFLERANGQAPEVLASAVIPRTAAIELRVTGNDTHLVFEYATRKGNWQALIPDADATVITVQAAGGGLHFTGAVVGVYARLDASGGKSD